MHKIKLLSALMIGVFALALAGCGDSDTEKNLNAKDKWQVGIIAHLNASEEKYNEYMQKLEKSYRPSKANLSMNFHYYNSLNEMQLALKAGQIDVIDTYQFVADYMASRDSDLEIIPSEKNLTDSFCFAVREDDKDLLNGLDTAISEIIADGTMSKLAEQYITSVARGGEVKPVPISEIVGAETLKVAVTGDLPPFDMMTADGKPTGYSTAVMAEISRRIGKNVEFVSVDSAARATALASKKADVIFWVAVPSDSSLVPDDVDVPAGLALSKSYYSENIVHVALKVK